MFPRFETEGEVCIELPRDARAGISILPARLRGNIPPVASARDLFCIRSRAKDPGVLATFFAGTKKTRFVSISRPMSRTHRRSGDFFCCAAGNLNLLPGWLGSWLRFRWRRCGWSGSFLDCRWVGFGGGNLCANSVGVTTPTFLPRWLIFKIGGWFFVGVETPSCQFRLTGPSAVGVRAFPGLEEKQQVRSLREDNGLAS